MVKWDLRMVTAIGNQLVVTKNPVSGSRRVDFPSGWKNILKHIRTTVIPNIPQMVIFFMVFVHCMDQSKNSEFSS